MRASLPILITLAAAAFVAALPALAPWLRYDRDAILAGEIWRLFTGHWVHFSRAHFGYNAAVIAIAGFILTSRPRNCAASLLLIAPWFISAAMLVLDPRMRIYGGLSALATGLVIAVALDSLARRREQPSVAAVGALLLVLFVAKSAIELATSRAIFASDPHANFTVAPLSHLLGGAAAMVIWWSNCVIRAEQILAPSFEWSATVPKASRSTSPAAAAGLRHSRGPVAEFRA